MAVPRLNFLLFLGLFIGLAMAEHLAVDHRNGTATTTGHDGGSPTSTSQPMPTTDIPNPNGGGVSVADPGFVLLSLAFGLVTLGMSLV